jgi:small subunit ribosomal protein S6
MADKPNYDLMVLLDPEAPEERRAQLIEQIRGQIQSGDATLKGDADWGMRRLAYEIDHRAEAQYHLFQFEASADLLTSLDRSLSIDDAVLRFRTIRLPGEAPEQTPEAPPQTSFESGRREGRGRDDRGDRGDRRPSEARSEDAEQEEAAAIAEAAAAPRAEAPEPAEPAAETPQEPPQGEPPPAEPA